eukprot:6198983-Pleurochrysis_carterae.AAC.14
MLNSAQAHQLKGPPPSASSFSCRRTMRVPASCAARTVCANREPSSPTKEGIWVEASGATREARVRRLSSAFIHVRPVSLAMSSSATSFAPGLKELT